MTDAPRTVADVLRRWLSDRDDTEIVDVLDMPYDQFRRRLEMGERAEKAKRTDDRGWTWNRCLDYIRGDQHP